MKTDLHLQEIIIIETVSELLCHLTPVEKNCVLQTTARLASQHFSLGKVLARESRPQLLEEFARYPGYAGASTI